MVIIFSKVNTWRQVHSYTVSQWAARYFANRSSYRSQERLHIAPVVCRIARSKHVWFLRSDRRPVWKQWIWLLHMMIGLQTGRRTVFAYRFAYRSSCVNTPSVASQPIDEGRQSPGAPSMLGVGPGVFVNIFLLTRCTQNSDTLVSSVSV